MFLIFSIITDTSGFAKGSSPWKIKARPSILVYLIIFGVVVVSLQPIDCDIITTGDLTQSPEIVQHQLRSKLMLSQPKPYTTCLLSVYRIISLASPSRTTALWDTRVKAVVSVRWQTAPYLVAELRWGRIFRKKLLLQLLLQFLTCRSNRTMLTRSDLISLGSIFTL